LKNPFMNYEVKSKDGYQYIDEGQGHTLILLHGLFGALSNWIDVIKGFSSQYRIVIPLIPIFDYPVLSTNVSQLEKFTDKFISHFGFNDFTLVGNSLGGHVALMHSLRHPEKIKHLVLTASSGLYENTLGGGFPRREDYNFIKEKVAVTFYDPKNATKELVDECFETVNDRNRLIRILALAKSAIRHNMADELKHIKMPTCLIWGRNDTITPPDVAEEFHALLPVSDLFFIDKCGHAPMMEQPEEFNRILREWLALQLSAQKKPAI
jgi:pimeloyl-ACP methyl ester carboxylesterase